MLFQNAGTARVGWAVVRGMVVVDVATAVPVLLGMSPMVVVDDVADEVAAAAEEEEVCDEDVVEEVVVLAVVVDVAEDVEVETVCVELV